MKYLPILLIVAAVFLVCWLVDKGFTKAFRSKAQHQSGLSIRPSKRYGSMGVIVAMIGVAGILAGINDGNAAVIVGGSVLVLSGIGLSAYYVSTGIFYDEDSFLYSSFGKKGRTYRYRDIMHQQLYQVQGGHYIIELHMADGSAVMIQTQMEGHREFLSYAAEKWYEARGVTTRDPKHYDPDRYVWFPCKEDL